jgi:hypothetical protein
VAALTLPEATAKLSTSEYVPVSCGGIGRDVQEFPSPLEIINGICAPVISLLLVPGRPIETVNPVVPANCVVSDIVT